MSSNHLTPDFDLVSRTFGETFHKHHIAGFVEGGDCLPGVPVVVVGEVDCGKVAGQHRRRLAARRAVTMRILAWGIQFVFVSSMLDGTHAQPAFSQFPQKFEHQRGFSVILPTDYLHDEHLTPEKLKDFVIGTDSIIERRTYIDNRSSIAFNQSFWKVGLKVPFQSEAEGMKRCVSILQFLVGFAVILATGCFDSSPNFIENNNSSSGDEEVENETSSVLVGREGKTISLPGLEVILPMNALDSEVNLVVERIVRTSFTELPDMVSDAFFIGLEPEVALNLPVEIRFDLSLLDVEHLLGMNALIVRKIQPGDAPVPLYVQSSESGSEVVYETTSLGLFGVFVSQCYELCQKVENCPPTTLDGNTTLQNSIRECVQALPVVRETDTGTEQIFINCRTNMNELNSQEFQIMVDCATNHDCEDAGNCCLHDPPNCGEVVTDGDDDADADLDLDMDEDVQDTDPDDGDEEDVEEDQDVPTYDFSPCVCSSSNQCGEDPCIGDECHIDSALGMSANQGICMETPDQSNTLQLYEWNGSAFSLATEQIADMSCIGQEPNNLTGESVYDLEVRLETYWPIDTLEGITVELYLETGSNPYEGTPYATRLTNSSGRVEFSDSKEVEANHWFAVRVYRAAGDGVEEIPDIWNFGYFIDGAKAADDLVTVTAHFIAADNLTALKNVYLGTDEIPAGYGMVIGQLTDCSANGYVLANAAVGFVDARPLHLRYFNSNNTPGPTPNRYTSKNGLFMGIFMPPQDRLTVFSAAHAKETQSGGVAFRTVAMSPGAHVRVKPDAVSWIRFNVTNLPPNP